MSGIGWLLIVMVAPLSADRAIALYREVVPDVGIRLEEPTGTFRIGEPITLTVTFTNTLNRDVQVTAFYPELSPAEWQRSVCANLLDGWMRTSQVFETTTDVHVTRVTGVPRAPLPISRAGIPDRDFSLVLKGGAFASQTFDLMQTRIGSEVVNSPGRFRISLFHKTCERRANRSVRTNTQVPPQWEGEPLEWEGEVRAAPIEIVVVESENQ